MYVCCKVLVFFLLIACFCFQRASFSTPLRALFKTATMTIGEFEYDSLFRQDPGGLQVGDIQQDEIQFEALARVLWLIFLIFMPIILINLLVRAEGVCSCIGSVVCINHTPCLTNPQLLINLLVRAEGVCSCIGSVVCINHTPCLTNPQLLTDCLVCCNRLVWLLTTSRAFKRQPLSRDYSYK